MVIKLIIPENQLISMVEDQGFLCHLEFLNPRHALQSWHYITLIPLSSSCWYVHKFCGAHTAEHVKQTIEEMLNACKIDKQHPHHFMRQRKEYEKSNG